MILWFLKWRLRRVYRGYQNDLQKWKAGRISYREATLRSYKIAVLSNEIARRERLQKEV